MQKPEFSLEKKSKRKAIFSGQCSPRLQKTVDNALFVLCGVLHSDSAAFLESISLIQVFSSRFLCKLCKPSLGVIRSESSKGPIMFVSVYESVQKPLLSFNVNGQQWSNQQLRVELFSNLPSSKQTSKNILRVIWSRTMPSAQKQTSIRQKALLSLKRTLFAKTCDHTQRVISTKLSSTKIWPWWWNSKNRNMMSSKNFPNKD